MATVTLSFPELIDAPEKVTDELVTVAGEAAFEELTIAADEIKASGEVPTNLGNLKRSLAARPVTRDGDRIRTGIHAPGVASNYAIVMDVGRRPGQKGPPLAPIEKWVKRQMRDEVNTLARKFQAQDRGKKKRKFKGSRKPSSRAIGKYRERAIFLIARSVRDRIHKVGIAARGFVARRRRQIADRVKAHVADEIARHMNGDST